MKLTDLEPKFRKLNEAGQLQEVETIEEAEVVTYLCPKCFLKNGGAVGTHLFMTPNKKLQPGTLGGKIYWEWTGKGMDDLTTNPSILDVGGCGAHFYIKNGEIEMV